MRAGRPLNCTLRASAGRETLAACNVVFQSLPHSDHREADFIDHESGELGDEPQAGLAVAHPGNLIRNDNPC